MEKTLSNLQSAVSKLRVARNKTVMGMLSSRGGLSDVSSVNMNRSISRSGVFDNKSRKSRITQAKSTRK